MEADDSGRDVYEDGAETVEPEEKLNGIGSSAGNENYKAETSPFNLTMGTVLGC